MEDNSNGNLCGIVLSNGGIVPGRLKKWQVIVEVLGLVWCISLLTSSGIKKKMNNLYIS